MEPGREDEPHYGYLNELSTDSFVASTPHMAHMSEQKFPHYGNEHVRMAEQAEQI